MTSARFALEPFLARIGYTGPLEPTHDTLRGLHRAFVLSVPFENLDIVRGHEIVLDVDRFHEKVVGRRRGGFCYELNGLFARALTEIGFRVTLVSGRVNARGREGPEFDHLVLLVDLAERWVADVGFGDSFREPLRLDTEADQSDGVRTYAIRRQGEDRHLLRLTDDGDWESQFVFTTIPRELGEFADMCRFQQTSPESHFTTGSICSLALPDGRVTLRGRTLVETDAGGARETEVAEADVERVLLDRFGIAPGT